jgi:hypothetical protein
MPFDPPGNREMEAAGKYEDPGRFAAFIGYEWTSIRAGKNRYR